VAVRQRGGPPAPGRAPLRAGFPATSLRHYCDIAAASRRRPCSVPAASLQHHGNVTAASLQHHCNTAATSQQHYCSITATPRQRHSSITAASLQHHGNVTAASLQHGRPSADCSRRSTCGASARPGPIARRQSAPLQPARPVRVCTGLRSSAGSDGHPGRGRLGRGGAPPAPHRWSSCASGPVAVAIYDMPKYALAHDIAFLNRAQMPPSVWAAATVAAMRGRARSSQRTVDPTAGGPAGPLPSLVWHGSLPSICQVGPNRVRGLPTGCCLLREA
jgi:hypothetical protein